MDVQRPGSRKRTVRRVAYAVVAALAFLLLAGFAWSLAVRPPGVDQDQVWSGEVVRGEFVHEVTAQGSLVALEIRTVTTRSGGVVEHVNVLAGHVAKPDDVLVELSSPKLEEDLNNARSDLEAAEAKEKLRQAEAEDDYLQVQSDAATAEADYTTAKMEAEAYDMLLEAGAATQIEAQQRVANADQRQRRMEAARAKLERYPETSAARDTAAQADLDKQRRNVEQLKEKVAELKVQAGFKGVVQEIMVEEGERVGDGGDIAKVVNPDVLVARVRVSERDAGLIELGQSARLEMGRKRLTGKVSRVEPTVRDRLVTVDISLDPGDLSGLRPDLTVTARIEIDRAADTLVLEKPANLRDDNKNVDLFRLDDSGKYATRVPVEIGRVSTQQVEIVHGLEEGDRVILADMSDWLEEPEIRIR